MTSTLCNAQNIIVMLLEGVEESRMVKKANELAEGEYFTEENSRTEENVLVGVLATSNLASLLMSRVHNKSIGDKKALAFTLDRYIGLHKLSSTNPNALSINRSIVKKISNESTIQTWKREIGGEQFVIYNDGEISNYEISKMFLCKQTRARPQTGIKLDVYKDLVIVQKQKNLYIYGGNLELVDGFVIDSLIEYRLIDNNILIGTEKDENTSLWEIHHIYTKDLIKRIEAPAKSTVMVSQGMTHYSIISKNEVSIRSIHSDEEILQEQTAVKEAGEKCEVYFSEQTNQVLLAKITSVGVLVTLFCLTTGTEVRKKILNGIKTHKIQFTSDGVSIVYTRKTQTATTHFVDFWEYSGASSISKALGEGVEAVHITPNTVIVLEGCAVKIFKKTPGVLVEVNTMKGDFCYIAPGELSALFDTTNIYIIGKNGEILKEIPMPNLKEMKWSPFSLYLAVLDMTQVRVIDICGKELFASNIPSLDSFHWRIPIPLPETEPTKEDMQRYKEEDTIRKTKAKEQFLQENQACTEAWRSFLSTMKEFYLQHTSVSQTE
ncbi:hypothetical protein NEOKW01_0585 [Nematocida sp. AWRm80]|nr:hypothetical protein NEOKW01_0585 [Nematocida sp. AWRm80]